MTIVAQLLAVAARPPSVAAAEAVATAPAVELAPWEPAPEQVLEICENMVHDSLLNMRMSIYDERPFLSDLLVRRVLGCCRLGVGCCYWS